MKKRKKMKKFGLKKFLLLLLVAMLEILITYFCIGWIHDTAIITPENTKEITVKVDRVFFKKIIRYYSYDLYTDEGIFTLNPKHLNYETLSEIKKSITTGDKITLTIRKAKDWLGPFNKTYVCGLKTDEIVYVSFDHVAERITMARPLEVIFAVFFWCASTLLIFIGSYFNVFLTIHKKIKKAKKRRKKELKRAQFEQRAREEGSDKSD